MYRPKIWLFEGQSAGEQYSEKSLQNVLKQPLEKAQKKTSHFALAATFLCNTLIRSGDRY